MSKKLIISDQLALPLDAVTQTFAFLARKGDGQSCSTTGQVGRPAPGLAELAGALTAAKTPAEDSPADLPEIDFARASGG
jgi:hypothetical protein